MEEDSDEEDKRREKENKKAEERKAAMKDKLGTKNKQKHQEGSRVNSAHSSRSSKSQMPQENKVLQVYITKFAQKSEQNDSRIAMNTVNGCIYILLLGFYMKVSNIRTIIRKQKNINSIKELLDTRNEVFSLEEQEIKDQLSGHFIKDEIKHLLTVLEMYID